MWISVIGLEQLCGPFPDGDFEFSQVIGTGLQCTVVDNFGLSELIHARHSVEMPNNTSHQKGAQAKTRDRQQRGNEAPIGSKLMLLAVFSCLRVAGVLGRHSMHLACILSPVQAETEPVTAG